MIGIIEFYAMAIWNLLCFVLLFCVTVVAVWLIVLPYILIAITMVVLVRGLCLLVIAICDGSYQSQRFIDFEKGISLGSSFKKQN